MSKVGRAMSAKLCSWRCETHNTWAVELVRVRPSVERTAHFCTILEDQAVQYRIVLVCWKVLFKRRDVWSCFQEQNVRACAITCLQRSWIIIVLFPAQLFLYLPKYVPYEWREEVQTKFKSSVADPRCLSRIRFSPSRIQGRQDPGSEPASKNLGIFDPNNWY